MQRDYLMRMIEQAVAGLIGIVRKAESGNFQLAQRDFDQTCRDTIGLDLGTVKDLSPDAVAELLAQSGALRYTRSLILAEIMLHDAEVRQRADPTKLPLANFVHAFCLIADSVNVLGHEQEAKYRHKLAELAGQLSAYRHLPQLEARFVRSGL